MHDWSLRNSSRELEVLGGLAQNRMTTNLQEMLELIPPLHRRLQRYRMCSEIERSSTSSVSKIGAGNLPLIHHEIEELSLIGGSLNKQEVEQPEVDRFDLDDRGLKWLDKFVRNVEAPPQVTQLSSTELKLDRAG
ncbi:hypothetical protein Tco_0627527 [Tanacetum coccineum]|uniref:Uncharacterized protein n=1 Tax=Tanacetum coccineum TaxID=301880 RepID=A0ABQ4WMN2_9ASTR